MQRTTRRFSWKPQSRSVNLFEGLALIPVGGLLLAIETQRTPPTKANWEGGILGDDFARELPRGATSEVQRTAAKVSDLLFMGGAVLPILIDVAVVTWGVHGKPDLAWQMFLIDLQSLFLAGLPSLTPEHAVGRARPYIEDCGPDGVVRDDDGQRFGGCGSPGDKLVRPARSKCEPNQTAAARHTFRWFWPEHDRQAGLTVRRVVSEEK